MKKKILQIVAGAMFCAVTILPSCELIEACGDCTLVTVDLDGIISYGKPQFVCGDIYLDYKDSEITTTIDGQQYWDCE